MLGIVKKKKKIFKKITRGFAEILKFISTICHRKIIKPTDRTKVLLKSNAKTRSPAAESRTIITTHRDLFFLSGDEP